MCPFHEIETLTDLAEFLFEDRVTDLFDTEGRPVSEATSSVQGLVTCPYPDARYGQSMNQPALRQLTQHWNHVLDWVSPEQAEQASLRESLSVALWATLEPCLFRLANPRLPIPVEMSVRYKACLGYCQVLFFLLWNDVDPDSACLSDYGTSTEFFRWLDTEGWLLGQHQVCPGPKAMIEQLFTRFCSARLSEEKTTCLEEVMCLIALQSVHLLGSHKTMGTLATRFLKQGQAPWLFAIIQKPDRDPNEVCKLFASGLVPPRVAQLLMSPTSEELFRALCFTSRVSP